MILTQPQVAALWVSEGGNPRKADTWSAIIMGESGGDTNAHEGGDPRSCCHGFAQLNVEVGNASMACALNAVCATRKSIKLSNNGRDFSPWGAFTDGSYTQYLGGSGFGTRPPSRHKAKGMLVDLEVGPFHVGTPGPDINLLHPFNPGEAAEKGLGIIGGADIPVVSDLANSLRNIAAFFRGIGELILTPEGWLRMGKLLGGAILLFWGLRIIIRESTGTDPVKTATKTAAKGAELAALAATVK